MITYRRTVLSDAEKLTEIRLNFLIEIENISSKEEIALIKENCMEFFRKTLSDGSSISWFALNESEEVVATGGASLSLVPPNGKNPNGKVAYITNMFTFPKYRKQGIATELFNRIVEDVKKLGYNTVTLKATAAGRPIYEKFGFEDSKNEMVYYGF